MAKIKPNAILEAMSGTIGKTLVVRQMRDGSIIISGKRDFSRRKFSKEQLTHQTRFQEAVTYARHAAKSQPIYAQLAEGTTKTAYNIALSDWFNPPVIHQITSEKEFICVEATDNILVTKVVITILDEHENALEQGEAILIKGLWEYIPATQGRVKVEAYDLAGNVTRKETA
jgi:hypothetical protein